MLLKTIWMLALSLVFEISAVFIYIPFITKLTDVEILVVRIYLLWALGILGSWKNLKILYAIMLLGFFSFMDVKGILLPTENRDLFNFSWELIGFSLGLILFIVGLLIQGYWIIDVVGHKIYSSVLKGNIEPREELKVNAGLIVFLLVIFVFYLWGFTV